MCEYCEEPNDLAFSKRKDFSICVADRTLFINSKNINYRLNIAHSAEKN